MYIEINRWLIDKNATYTDGLKLLQQADAAHKDLFLLQICESSRHREILKNALKELVNPITETAQIQEVVNPIAEPKKKQYSPDMYFSMPANMQALEKEKATLLKSIIKNRSELKKALGFSLPNKIKLSEVLKCMGQYDTNGNPIPFSISYVTANRTENTGGEWRSINRAVMSYQNKTGTKIYTGKKMEQKTKRKPNHWFNATRNILPVGGNSLSNIHIWLIMEFNGREVQIGTPG